MNDQFAQLAMMQPQGGMPPTPPPSAGPVGGRLAQLWDAFKTDPNMRQAVLAASTSMMQSPPPGQNSLGMIGAGVQHGAQTYDALKERQRAQGIDEQRHEEQMGLKRQGVALQERGLDEQVDARRADRRFRSLMTMNAQEFQRTESELNRTLQKELAGMQHGREGRQSTHPTVHLAEAFGERMYNSNPSQYDKKATEFNAADQGARTGLDLAIAEQVRIQNEAARYVRQNPDFYNHEAFKARLGVEGAYAEDPIKAAIAEQVFGDNPEQLSQILEIIRGQTPTMSGQDQPAASRRDSDALRAPWPPGAMNPLGENRSPNAAGMQERESWNRLANSGATRRDRSGNLVRLTRSGSDYYFIGLDENGNETERQLATIEQLRGFAQMPGR